MTFEIRLDVFEGPFEVLLTLITERRLDVCDVPIAQLTESFLEHIAARTRMDLEVTTEFLVVAATLLQLKARALLPGPPADEEEADDLERDLLIARLLEVRTFQAAGGILAERLAEGDMRHPGAPAPDDPALRMLPTLADIAAGDLAAALVELIREATRTVDVSLLVSDEVSTEQAVADLVERLGQGPVLFADIARSRGIAWAVALFLAMLELSMRGEVLLGQGERLGDIEISLVTYERADEPAGRTYTV
jgi:segregation and condensation protein A